MQKVMEFARQAARRINRRIAVGLAVIAATGIVFWQGARWLDKKPPAATPTKQVATGVQQPAETGNIAPAAASLSDDVSVAVGPGSHNLGTQYAQFLSPSTSPATVDTGTPQPPTSSYLPASSDPAGGGSDSGSSRSAYVPGGSAYSPYAAATQSAPAEASSSSAAMALPPENPYRSQAAITDSSGTRGLAGAASGSGESVNEAPLSRSPYAAATESVANDYSAATQPSSAPPPGSAPIAEAPPTTYQPSATYQPPATYQAPPAAVAAAPESAPPAMAPQAAVPSLLAPNPLPPNSLPPASLATSPYAAAATTPVGPPQTIDVSPPAGRVPATNPYLSATTPPATLPTTPPAAGKLAAAPTPGERQLEGPQQPSLTLEKVSPSEIQIGKPAKFELFVRNVGQAAARDVIVTDHVPAGTQLEAARPEPQRSADGSLVWNLGTLQPGEESQITLQVLPQTEGEIGSTAHVTFAAAATSRSICTRPQLTIEHTAPPKALIGESVAVGITVSNPGTGPATGVIIEEDVPDGLSHVAGALLEYEIGTLRPGESKRLELSLRAEKAGIVQNVIHVRGDANLAATHTVQIEVVAPQLQVGVEGPKLRFLERQATYTVQVANAGTAAARDIELAAFLPRGLKFVSTDSQGQYDAAQHAVFWSLAELPPAALGSAKLTTLPVEPGEQKLKVQASAALNLTAESEQVVRVEQVAELLHTVKDVDDVIEVGSETTYEIRVTNQGTKAATNVRLAAAMPAGMAALSGDGPTRASGDATQIVFEPLAALRPQEEVVWRIQAKGLAAGDQIIRVQLASDESPTPVTREESTRVYQDR
jgi:uncharacterized repeat protein (TIGR01451 family)